MIDAVIEKDGKFVPIIFRTERPDSKYTRQADLYRKIMNNTI